MNSLAKCIEDVLTETIPDRHDVAKYAQWSASIWEKAKQTETDYEIPTGEGTLEAELHARIKQRCQHALSQHKLRETTLARLHAIGAVVELGDVPDQLNANWPNVGEQINGKKETSTWESCSINTTNQTLMTFGFWISL